MRQGQSVGQKKRAKKRAQLELKAAIQIQSLARMKSGQIEVACVVCGWFFFQNALNSVASRPDSKRIALRLKDDGMQNFEAMLQLKFNLQGE